MDSTVDTSIKAAPCPHCIICGSPGRELYSGLTDRLFGAAGNWNVKRCTNSACQTLWPDPMPAREELWKAYVKYYTHISPVREKESPLSVFINEVAEDYGNQRWGYSEVIPQKHAPIFAALLFFAPMRRRNISVAVRFLNHIPKGKILDVGCGAGQWLIEMKQRGWEPQGLDFDPKAVEAARAAGIDVKCGSVEEQRFPANHYDAVTLSHVVEHVPDPRQTIQECFRILKPGGKLVIITPNGQSLGHKVFGRDWRGLEPPRHLHVFSPQSLQMLMIGEEPGAAITCYPQIVRSIIYESLLLKLTGGIARPRSRLGELAALLAALFFNCVELPLIWMKPAWADCMAVVAIKPLRP